MGSGREVELMYDRRSEDKLPAGKYKIRTIFEGNIEVTEGEMTVSEAIASVQPFSELIDFEVKGPR